MGGERVPSVGVFVDGDSLHDARYRLVSLDSSVVAVDSTGHAVRGLRRDTTSVRVVFLTAASGESTPDTTFRVLVVAVGVTVNPAVHTLEELGASVRLTATALDADGEGLTETVSFDWTSSDEAVATVDATGLVTAVNEGSATISAEVDDVTGMAELTVVQVVTDVQVQPGADTLFAVGRTTQFTVLAWRDEVPLTHAKFSWVSSDTGVAVVDADGVATAVGEGMTQIVAEAGEVADTSALLVDQIARFVFLNPETTTVALDDTVRLSASALDSASMPIPAQLFAWQSDNTNVATVETGLVTTHTTGAATVSVTADGVPATAAVTVLVPATIAVTPGEATLRRGNTLALLAVVRDAGGTVIDAVTLSWSSSDETVVTVNTGGVVTAVGNGTATIRTTATGGVAGDATVSVQEPVASLELSQFGASISTASLGCKQKSGGGEHLLVELEPQCCDDRQRDGPGHGRGQRAGGD